MMRCGDWCCCKIPSARAALQSLKLGLWGTVERKWVVLQKLAEERTERDHPPALLSLGGYSKQAGNEGHLPEDVAFDHAVHLPLADHVYALVSFYAYLGHPQDAKRELEQGLAQLDPAWTFRRLAFYIDLLIAHSLEHNVEQACHSARQAARGAAQAKVPMTLERVQDAAHTFLKPWKEVP